MLVMLCSSLGACGNHAQPVHSGPPTRQVRVSSQAEHLLEGRVRRLLVTEGEAELRVSEEEATSYLAGALPAHRVTRVTVWFSPDGIDLQVDFIGLGNHQLWAYLTVQVEEGSPQVRIRALALDGRQLPRFLRLSAQETANDALADLHLPIEFRGIVLGEGYVTIRAGRD